jgi:hypothetical protein
VWSFKGTEGAKNAAGKLYPLYQFKPIYHAYISFITGKVMLSPQEKMGMMHSWQH